MALLDDFLAERRALPFAWGRQDCCTFAADWVRAKTGTDPMADLRGLTSALSAMRRLRALGGFKSAGEQRLGPAVPGRMARVGDVVLVPSGRKPGRASGYSFGICNGPTVAVPGVDRVQFAPISLAVAAWRV